MSRRLRAAALCAALALPGAVVPAASARPGTSCWPDQVRVWRIRRHGAAPRALDATLEYRSLGSRSTLFVVAAEQRGGRWNKAGAFMYVPMGNEDAYAYGYGGDAAPVTTPDRPTAIAPACERTSGLATRPILKKAASTYDWFVAAIQTEVTIKVKGPGWTVTELTPTSGASLRIYRNDDGRGTGVVAGSGVQFSRASVEHFKGVAADGGRYGSVAFAWLPCEPLGAWVPDPTNSQPTGWGAATLIGGDITPISVEDRYLKCDGFDFSGFGMASGPTKWTLYGEAIGESIVLNRLTIFDFPKP